MEPSSVKKPIRLTVAPSSMLEAVRASLRDGDEIVRLRRGSFAVVPPGLDRWQREISLHLALCAAISRDVSAEHALGLTSAARVHGLRTWTVVEKPHLIIGTRTSSRSATDHHRHLLDLPEEDVVVAAGVRVVRLERVAVDCARFLHPRDALVVVDHVVAVLSRATFKERVRTERSAATVRHELTGRIERLPGRSRGRARARAVIAWSTPWSESAWESHLRWVVLCWGRRDVVVQQVVPTRRGTYRTDLSIPLEVPPGGRIRWLHIEFDGLIKYGAGDPEANAQTIVEERERERAIEATGDVVVRFTAREASSELHVVRALELHLLRSPLHARRPVRELVV
ncbi:hypothetical protein [Georgenia sp. Z1491]|uniref:hypothetical protein n=1 Tax=Georgenia sp. Z1491 TaxID=3416707 RepID=UPI003CF60601